MAALAAAVSGCGQNAPSVQSDDAEAGTPRHGGRVVFGHHQEPDILNGRLAGGSLAVTSIVNDPLWDQLVQLGPGGTYEPHIATEVPTYENGGVRLVGRGMVIRIALKQDARWSDGRPITCADVRFTWKTTLDPRWLIGNRTKWENVSSIECPTPHHVRMHLRKPDAAYLNNLVSMAPLPAHDIRGHDFNTYLNDKIPVSSGPFRFAEWKRGVFIRLVRNDNYWDAGPQDKPFLDEIVFKFLKDVNTVKIQMRSGEVDFIVPPFDTNAVAELETLDAQLHTDKSASWEQMGFNNERAPLDNVHVRRAIAASIDRQSMIDTISRGNAWTLQSFLLPAQKLYHVPAWEKHSLDLELAARELQQAGYRRDGPYWHKDGRPLQLTLYSTSGHPLRFRLVQIIQQQLERAGLKVTVRLVPVEVLFSNVIRRANFDMAIWGWGQGMEPSLEELFRCGAIPRKPGYEGSNYYRYCNPAVSKLWVESMHEVKLERRRRLIHQIQRLMADDVPVLPLYQAPESIAHDRALRGVDQNPMAGPTWNTQDWWLQ